MISPALYSMPDHTLTSSICSIVMPYLQQRCDQKLRLCHRSVRVLAPRFIVELLLECVGIKVQQYPSACDSGIGQSCGRGQACARFKHNCMLYLEYHCESSLYRRLSSPSLHRCRIFPLRHSSSGFSSMETRRPSLTFLICKMSEAFSVQPHMLRRQITDLKLSHCDPCCVLKVITSSLMIRGALLMIFCS